MNQISHMLDEIERPTPAQYSGRFEGYFAFLSYLFFFLFRIITQSRNAREQYGEFVLDLPFQQGIGFVLFDALFSTFFYVSIVIFATKGGSEWIKTQLANNKGMLFAIIVPAACAIYQILAMLIGFPQITIDWRNSISNIYWEGCPWIVPVLGGIILLFVAIRVAMLLAFLRQDRKNFIAILKVLNKNSGETNEFHNQEREFALNFIVLLIISPLLFLTLGLGWLSLLAPIAIFILYLVAKLPFFNQNADGMTIGDVLTGALAIGPVIICQTLFSLAWCFTLPLAAIFLFHITGLGREHFHFSFVPQKAEEVPELMNTVLFTILTFIPIAILIGFIDPVTGWKPDVTGQTLFEYAITWIYLVGISEEVIFRCGVLILLADGIKYWDKQKNWSQSNGFLNKIATRPMFTAMILAAIIFGLAHAPKGWDYALLATLAGFIYGLPFVKNKSLFGAIMLHAIVDVIAVAYFSAQL